MGGIVLGSSRVPEVDDVVEELALIPRVPYEKLSKLEEAWRSGEKDSVTVLADVSAWHAEKSIPGAWLEDAADRSEREADKKKIKDAILAAGKFLAGKSAELRTPTGKPALTTPSVEAVRHMKDMQSDEAKLAE